MANPIYLLVDVDCEVTILAAEPVADEVVNFYDGVYLKVEDGKIFKSGWGVTDETYVWREVEKK